ncbi:hypothetical protein [Paenibacillus chitinolyticus]|uniref:hypothetical protein n=1 Tax=Paenibacillus chitinolyticus TaxID=79263 RepID=UPI00295EFDB6|nr:hypothetical protein [Paenibacillus chitinolyticus]
MMITSERPFDGGTLLVTGVPVQKCDCEEQVLLGDGALMAGYARLLANHNIIGRVTVTLDELHQKFKMQDFLPKSVNQS